MAVKSISILGAGQMGSGIAHVAARAGFSVRLHDVSEDMLQRALRTAAADLQKGVEKGKLEPSDATAALARIKPMREIREAVFETDFVIEAVPENIGLKVNLFAQVDAIAPSHAVFASNTSGLSITEMATATHRPQRFVGMHFFNPVHLMRLVEIIRGLDTDPATVRTACEVAQRMGKETVEVRESPGFVTSRINALIGNEAFRMLQEGVASARDIDKALKLGLNHPMGPFEMVDLVGLDTRLAVLRHLHATLGETYRPNLLLEQMVKAGRLGKKAGRGVYEYPGASDGG